MPTNTHNDLNANASVLTTTFLELSQLCLSSLERLSALNLNTIREVLDQGMASADRMTRTPSESGQPEVKPLLDKSISYSHNVLEICATTQEEMMRLINGRIAELKLAPPLPPGWASAMDTITRSAQQIASMGAESVLSASKTGEQTAERIKERVTERPERGSGSSKSSNRAA